MLILSRVCAEFHDSTGAKIFSVTPETRLTFLPAPEAIREDPLFALLREDRLIEISDNGPLQRQLENDPEAKPQDPKSENPKAKPQDPKPEKPEKKPETPDPELKQKSRNEAGNKPSSRQGPADKP